MTEDLEKLPLLVFGIGPVIDNVSRIKADEAHTRWSHEDVPFWSHNLVEAIVELNSQHIVDQIVVMGGHTGGEQYKSESEIIKELLVKEEVPESKIFIETNSVETIENIVNFLNKFTDPDSDPSDLRVNILCAEYHTARTAILMKLFGIRVKDIFAAEEVIRYTARSKAEKPAPDQQVDEMTQKSNEILNKIEAILDPTPRHSFYESQKGAEKRDYRDRLLAEGFWTWEIFYLPERILYQASEIKNNKQLMEILKIAHIIYGDDIRKYEFDLEKDSPDELRSKMKKYSWDYITTDKTQAELDQMEVEKKKKYKDAWMAQYIASGWPKEVYNREEKLRAYTLYSTS